MGIYDRNYMHYQKKTPPMSGSNMLWMLIVINAAAYLLVDKNGELSLTITGNGFDPQWLWQIFTAGFLHTSFGHLFFNMWGLYLFGSLVSKHINGKKMLALYLAGAVFGNILFILFNFNTAITIRLMGASGAVCAIMAAAATLEPERRFMIIFMPFAPVKTTTLVICYTIMEIVLGIGDTGTSNVAHLAHLGGFITGYITMLIYFGRRLPWDPFRAFFKGNRPRRVSPFPPPPPKPQSNKSGDDSKVTQKELDHLLDKMSTNGINSLSEYEFERLRRARKQMRGEE